MELPYIAEKGCGWSSSSPLSRLFFKIGGREEGSGSSFPVRRWVEEPDVFREIPKAAGGSDSSGYPS